MTETHPRPDRLQKQPGGRTSVHRRLMRQPEKSICYIWFERNRRVGTLSEYSSISERTKKEVSENWNVGLKGESGTKRQTGKANSNEKKKIKGLRLVSGLSPAAQFGRVVWQKLITSSFYLHSKKMASVGNSSYASH